MPPCPLCQTSGCRDEGEILHARPTLVAGVEVDLGNGCFRLLRCPNCSFRFKFPPLPEPGLLDCYRRAAAGHWQMDPDPHERQFDRIRDALDRFAPAPQSDGAPRRVLEVGCFNGALLAFLGREWEKAAVEPSTAAAAIARERGVAILGRVLDGTVPAAHFDALLAIDLVEHLVAPLPFFQQAARVLRPGGVLVVVTADTEASTWRWHGSRHWYCNLPEHVSFFCKRALDYAAARCDMVTLDRQRGITCWWSCDAMNEARGERRREERSRTTQACGREAGGWAGSSLPARPRSPMPRSYLPR